jgi:hypothetical protein
MKKFITITAGVLVLALAGAACGSDAPSGGTSAAPPAASAAPADGPTATAEPTQADEVRAAAAEENFPYELSATDADVDAAGEAVCHIKGKTDLGDEQSFADATAAYDVVLNAIVDEGKTGLIVHKDGTDDSVIIYTALYNAYCPGK